MSKLRALTGREVVAVLKRAGFSVIPDPFEPPLHFAYLDRDLARACPEREG